MIEAETYLAKRDKTLKCLIDNFGSLYKEKKTREPFDSFVSIVISQQLSNLVSRSILNKIEILHGKRPFIADRFVEIKPDDLKKCGVSNNKIKTLFGLASAFKNNDISIKQLIDLDDNAVISKLTSYWGIGVWSAEIFMMFNLGRVDRIALNDAGLIKAHKILYPNNLSLELTSKVWRPYRAIAALYLWKFLDDLEISKKILAELS